MYISRRSVDRMGQRHGRAVLGSRWKEGRMGKRKEKVEEEEVRRPSRRRGKKERFMNNAGVKAG